MAPMDVVDPLAYDVRVPIGNVTLAWSPNMMRFFEIPVSTKSAFLVRTLVLPQESPSTPY